MSDRSELRLSRVAQVSLLLAAAACLLLWFVRIDYAISFFKPYMLVTTGFEEESLFPIWKFTQHLPVYTDPLQIPFTVSYYNWAFYDLYGWITRVWLHLLNLDAIWIPTIGRLVSIVFALISGVIFWLSMRSFAASGFFANRLAAASWTLIAALSPLVGYWSISVRPDIGALAFECAGLYVVLCHLRKQDHRLIVAAAFLFYLAWAFKQSSVTMLAGSALTLLFLKRWRAFFALSGIWWALVIVTLMVGGHSFRENVLFSQQHFPMLLSLGPRNALRAEYKNPFLWLCLAPILVWSRVRFRRLASDPIDAALTLTVLFSFSFALITAFKFGSNDNYYMPAAWVSMLGFAVLSARMRQQFILFSLAACSWFVIAGIALTPTGRTYYYDYRYQDSVHRIIAQKLSRLPGPAFVIEPYSNLPWVQRFSPHFVLGYAYDLGHEAGVSYEDGGWQGLVGEGYFATVVVDQNFTPSLFASQKYDLVDEYKDAYTDLRFYRHNDSQRP
jgi:hypothetical protein